MRWIARRKAAWVMSAWMAAAGGVFAADPTSQLPTGPAPEILPPVRLRIDAPERTGPPVLVLPPIVSDALPAASQELAPSIIAPTNAPPKPSTAVLAPLARVPDANNISSPVPPTALPAAPATPIAPSTISVAPAVSAPCSVCENPWARIPPVQVTPRPGFFLVPPTGCGYYTFLDQLHGNLRQCPPTLAYPPFAAQAPSGFDADYRYLDNPGNTEVDPFDGLKRMHPTPDTMVTIGGQSSIRFMDEWNSRLGHVDNTYDLIRNRVWADIWYKDVVRVYGEFISAIITGNELKPLPIDENRADMLNLFVDVKVAEIGGNPAYVRVGRQEMLLGSQRLVSPLDWANTRRTFEGVRGFWRSENVDFDAFWLHPVIIEPTHWDTANHNVQFYGAWASFRPAPGQFADLYYLGLDDDTVMADPLLTGKRKPRGDQIVHTVGARYAGSEGSFLFDFEGMLQSGHVVERDHCASAFTAEVGWAFNDIHWHPQAWIGYDYASGTKDPLSGDNRTFNQLFPFGHYYFGFLDLVGRQNIEDVSAQLAVNPENWLTMCVQGHNFRLAEARDSLYNAGGVGIRRSAKGIAGRDVGNEIDLTANFHLTSHQDVLIGYSKLFAGSFIKATGPAVSPDLAYLMYNFRW